MTVGAEAVYAGSDDSDVHCLIARGSRNRWLTRVLVADIYALVRLYRSGRARRPELAPVMLSRYAFAMTFVACALFTCAAAAQDRTPASPSGTAATAPAPGFLGRLLDRLRQPPIDVPYIATPHAMVEKMLDMARVTAEDYVIDLGSGDGRIVIAAAKRGARALGVEANAALVERARRAAERDGVADRAQFVRQDLFETDLSRATVITLFLGTDLNLRLRPRLLGLAPGTRIVSNVYGMGDWIGDALGAIDASHGCDATACAALLWIVPAQAAGTHPTPLGELSLRQQYQMLNGSLRTPAGSVPVHGYVVGTRLVLNADGREIHGRIDGARVLLQE